MLWAVSLYEVAPPTGVSHVMVKLSDVILETTRFVALPGVVKILSGTDKGERSTPIAASTVKA